jgi:hypothetical protein
VTVAKEKRELVLSKGAAFAKSRLKRLRQEDGVQAACDALEALLQTSALRHGN